MRWVSSARGPRSATVLGSQCSQTSGGSAGRSGTASPNPRKTSQTTGAAVARTPAGSPEPAVQIAPGALHVAVLGQLCPPVLQVTPA